MNIFFRKAGGSISKSWSVADICLLLLAGILLSCSASRKSAPARENPDHAFPFYYNALDDIQQGNFQSAVTNLDSAIYYRPGYSNFYFVKGKVYEFLQKPDSAITAYEQSLKLKSHNPEVRLRLGKLYLQEGEYENAAVNYKRAVLAYPDSTDLLLQLGKAYFLSGRYRLAMDQFKRYRRTANKPATELEKWRGMTLFEIGNYSEAAELLEKYLQAVPDDPQAQKYFGFTKFQMKQYDQAISALNRSLKYNPNDAELYLYRARYFLILDKPGAALEQLQLGLKLDSMNTDILYELGLFYYTRSKFQESKRYLHKTIQLAPDYWSAYRLLGFIYEGEKELEQAYQYYTLYLKNSYSEDIEVRKRLQAIEPQIKNN